jgi:signal transduction histidine kinase
VCQHFDMSVPTRDSDAPPSLGREIVVVGIASAVAVLVVWGWALGLHVANAHNGLIGASWTAVGLYIVRVRPHHREGWLFVAVGVGHAVMFFGRQYGLHDPVLPGASWLGWIGVWPLSLLIALFAWTLMAFPDGSLLSPGWRHVVRGMFAVAAAMAVMSALWPVEYGRVHLVARHPLDLSGRHTAEQVWHALRASFLLFQVAFTVALIIRIRRAEGDLVRQMRWLVYAVVLAIAVLLGGLAVSGSPVPGLLVLPLIPVACGAAILKRRLYDIDPVINRTLVVGALVALVTAGYVAIVLGVGSLVPAPTAVLSLLATAVVAVAFEPLRRRMQKLADRLVYGHRATPYEALTQMVAAADHGSAEVLDQVAETVARAVVATEVVIWLGPVDHLETAGSWPARIAPAELRSLDDLAADAGLHLRPLSHRGAVSGVVAVRRPPGEALTGAENRVLDDLVSQAALVVVQLNQAADLRAAVRRIVAAEDAARRRIERDLHDGAQHRLVTLGLELGAIAERAQAAGDPELASRIGEARSQLLDASAELRELARGLHPTVLTEAGLEVALATLADRSSVPVRLDVDLVERPGAEVEATAYFLVSEALTNAARHARAEVVTVAVSRTPGGDLDVRVSDDGIGGARLERGGGLQGLADRLAALGARLDVSSRAGAGTTIRAVLPCG